MALGAGLPGTRIALILLWRGDFSSKVQWTLTLFIVGLWWGISVALRDRVVYPLQTLSNLLAALREEDFSIRARGAAAQRPARRSAARDERAGRHAARAAARRARSHLAAADGDGGDSRGGLRLRPRSAAARWSTAPASGCWPGPSSACWAGPPTSWAWRRASPSSGADQREPDVSRRHRALGGAQRPLPPGRHARSSCWS